MPSTRRTYHLLWGLALATLAGCQHPQELAPTRRDIVDAVFGSGHLENANQYTVMANAEGFITATPVAEGDTVQAGQPLFRLSGEVQQTQVANAGVNLDYARRNAQQGSPQLAQLQLQIAQARQKARVDSTNFARYGRLVKTQAVSAADFENTRLAYENSRSSVAQLTKNLAGLQRSLRLGVANAAAQYDIQRATNQYYALKSQESGVVMNISKKAGDYVRKGDALALLGSGRMLIKLDIAEDDIGRLKVGQRALISLNSNKDRVYAAAITKIYPAFNTIDQAFIVEAAFAAAPVGLLNGTQLQANIIIEEKKQALVVPSYALVNDDYVLLTGSQEKRKVTVGIRTLEWTEITGGLRENDRLTLPKPR